MSQGIHGRGRSLKSRARRRSRRLSVEVIEPRVLLATLIVNSANDNLMPIADDVLTLREAILVANGDLAPTDVLDAATVDTLILGPIVNAPERDLIHFDIPEAGRQTIALVAALPTITDPVVIDGTTQEGFDGTPLIELDGANQIDVGLTILAGGGGMMPGAGTEIRGLSIIRFTDVGILINGSDHNRIAGNWIGLDAEGAAAGIGDGDATDAGIRIVDGAHNVVGGPTLADRNVISANAGSGVRIAGASASGNLLAGNFIGTDITGTMDLGNAGDGVRIVDGASDNTIGGLTDDQGNVIAFNGGAGVAVDGALTVGNRILANAIFDNEGLGIALLNGGNNDQAAPVLNDVFYVNADQVRIGGTLQSTAETEFFIEFFVSPEADPSGFGEGQTFLGRQMVTTDGDGQIMFDFDTLVMAGVFVPGVVFTATATNVTTGDTSEFSAAFEFQPFVVTTTDDDGYGSLRRAIENANIQPGRDTISFDIMGPGPHTITVVLEPLPEITEAVVIDGTTQEGFDGTPLIELDGANVIDVGLTIGPDGGGAMPDAGTEIRGLSIIRFTDVGILINGSDHNRIAGNWIGLDAEGAAAGIGDGDATDAGIRIVDGAHNVVGGPTLADRNVISANAGSGVRIAGASASGNLIAGNFIGTDVNGNAGLGNALDGVLIEAGASANIVSDSLISRNLGNGVQLAANGNSVTDSTISNNMMNGVLITGSGNSVAGNGITANGANGVRLSGAGAVDNTVTGNTITVNALDGVRIDSGASANTIGGTLAQGNTISGNSLNGVAIVGASSNLLAGNRIGTNAAGDAALSNGVNGVRISGASVGNIVGGVRVDAAQPMQVAGNLISGNLASGVQITGAGTTGNLVLGNFIGTNADGTGALGNALDGVRIDVGATNNTVGAGNVLSGNLQNGVRISGAGTNANLVVGNFVGTDVTGAIPLGNGTIPEPDNGEIDPSTGHGVLIELGASGNTIGAVNTVAGLLDGGNLISGNVFTGVTIDASADNLVLGNFVGTDITGTMAVANGTETLPMGVTDPTGLIGNGVVLRHGASGNIIGMANALPGALTAGNLISGNLADGVRISGATTTGNQLFGNFLGTDADGANGLPTLGNAGHGVQILGASGNSVGAGNRIADNALDGVHISLDSVTGDPAHDNTVTGSTITANRGNGVRITALNVAGGATGNVVSGSTITANLFNGVLIDSAASNNTVGVGNILSGNGANGVRITGAGGNLVTGSMITANSLNGVRIDTEASSNVVSSNTITANVLDGVRIDNGASNNTIGVGNQISGNLAHGVQITDLGTSGNLVIGNLIGTNAAGNAALGNSLDGVVIQAMATANTVGGPTASDRNVLSGNLQNGVRITGAGTIGNLVLGNRIGTNAVGNAAVGNALDGVRIDVGASGNTVGSGNVLSGNLQNGVRISGAGTNANLVLGNRIGTNAVGNAAVGNVGQGVLIELNASANTIGGTLAQGNTISGNSLNGVAIVGASNNLLAGNRIGTNAAGDAALSNGGQGVLISGASVGNIVGGVRVDAASPMQVAGNLISGNAGSGVQISGMGATGNVLLGNFLGTNASGTAALGNLGDGVLINAPNNTVGGMTALDRNVISGNRDDGIEIVGVSGILVLGNFIGTDLTGTMDLGNADNGMVLNGASNNTIGAGNLISGNDANGILITGSGSTINRVLGNVIGTNVAGNAALGNGGSGVLVNASASSNTIGGVMANERNVVSGNAAQGVQITGAGTSANLVLGNRIGTNQAATVGLGNIGDGVRIDIGASGNTIGSGNVISGNLANGIRITGAGTNANLVLGNFLGTNANGSAALGNALDGVRIDVGASGNTVGGSATTDRNIISGNAGDGVEIVGANGNLVLGNHIGTDAAGNADLGNAGRGVVLNNAAGNTVQSNVISGNGNPSAASPTSHGVAILGAGASGNVLTGNRIGTNVAGNAALGNFGNGVQIVGASGNTIGGTNATPGVLSAGNLISGNAGAGVVIAEAGASGNLVVGNFLGTNASGNAALGNALQGVRIEGASGNTIGGTTAGVRNLISGNLGDGVAILGSGAESNVVSGNQIGTNVDGNAALGNGGDGVRIASARTNTIGGTAAGAGNLISGNVGDGVEIAGSGASGNVLTGNRIGTNTSGSVLLGNNGSGVIVINAPANTIGGATVAARNLISGNLGASVVLNGAGASGNLVLGNFIGTNASGNAALGNALQGVRIEGASGNTIGGTTTGVRNLISGNLGDGVAILGSGAESNVVSGNHIGTNAAGNAALGNGGDGVRIASARTNTIGGTAAGAGNLISGNGGDGVEIAGAGASGNVLTGNRIGTDASGSALLGNLGAGVRIESASSNTIGAGNTIAGNALDGVHILAGALGNQVNGVQINNNLGSGVRISGAGTSANAVNGSAINSNQGDGVRIEASASNNTIGSGTTIAGNALDGVHILAGASGNQVNGVQINNNLGSGVRISGAGTSANAVAESTIRSNQANGVLIEAGATGNTIGTGSQSPGSGNAILGNSGDGVRIEGVGTNGNLVAGNFIGTALSNLGSGVVVRSASNTTIGGTTVEARNVISNNQGDGVRIEAGASGVLVSGNFIGVVGAGEVTSGNLGHGLVIADASNNTIGGEAFEARNLISGNSGDGILIAGAGASGNLVLGNFVGTNASGNGLLGNGGVGVQVRDGRGNTIGGALGVSGNLISSNLSGGLLLLGGEANVVLGNLIGTDSAGTSALGNFGDGITIRSGANHIIGGVAADQANVISANAHNGIQLTEGASGVIVAGNFLGTDITGTNALGNAGSGVLIADASNNQIGGVANVVSGNRRFGIAITGAGASGNLLAGNLIGTNAAGNAALGNAISGVVILNASNNRIIDGNVISGNDSGLWILGTASGNQVLGNLIGTDNTGTQALGNGGEGVLIDAGASNNVLGGNVVSANANNGIVLRGGASGNVVVDNRIGTDRNGTQALGNAGSGLFIGDASSNRIDFGNVVSANAGFGIVIAGPGATGNVVVGNLIGTDRNGNAPLGNGLTGILIFGAFGNVIGGESEADFNVISGNAEGGIRLMVGASGNLLIGNRIGTNRNGNAPLGNNGPGVILDGASDNTLLANVIAANQGNGVQILGPASDNLLAGNFLGTNVVGEVNTLPGTEALQAANDNRFRNTGSGVLIVGASENTIGPDNLISNNAGFGVGLVGGSGNRVVGNRIGTAPGAGSALPNGLNGVLLLETSANVLGGNVVSGNAGHGVEIRGGGASGNVLVDNHIGTNGDGTATLSNLGSGVHIENAPGNIIGGVSAEAGNLISGNGLTLPVEFRANVRILGPGATGNQILGNTIGTNAATDASLDPFASGLSAIARPLTGRGLVNPASLDRPIELLDDPRAFGVLIEAAAMGNTIGSGNVLSGGRAGVMIRDGATSNLVSHNFIGTNRGGLIANRGTQAPLEARSFRIGPPLGNIDGVRIADASNNTIGPDNVISGNLESGVRLQGLPSAADGRPAVGASNNLITGNRIGTNADGNAALGNQIGVLIFGGSGNTIGSGNVISGNVSTGVHIANGATIFRRVTTGGPILGTPGPESLGNVVLENIIGLDNSGTQPLGNLQGIFINDSPGNTIRRNTISGNQQMGVQFFASNTVGNELIGNRIGTDLNGNINPALGNGHGVTRSGFGVFFNQTLANAGNFGPDNLIAGNRADQNERRSDNGPTVQIIRPEDLPDRQAQGQIIQFDVVFNGYMDPVSAVNPANYRVNRANGAAVPIDRNQIEYNELMRTVTLRLTPGQSLSEAETYRVTLVSGAAGGLRSRLGIGLDGNADGTPGDGTVRTFDGLIEREPLMMMGPRPGRPGAAGRPGPAAVDALFETGTVDNLRPTRLRGRR